MWVIKWCVKERIFIIYINNGLYLYYYNCNVFKNDLVIGFFLELCKVFLVLINVEKFLSM